IALALVGGRPDRALVEALGDAEPLRRGAAAEALCRAGAKAQFPALRKLLDDRDGGVRLRVALALVMKNEREAVRVLIDLLGDVSRDQSWQVEDILARVAGEHAPKVTLDGTEAGRLKCHQEWTAWWKKHGATLDLAKTDLTQASLGFTLLIVFDGGAGTGKVMEVDRAGKPRWTISGVQNPCDAHILPGNRVLIAEHGANRVAERNFKGEVLWQHQFPNPTGCQRLPN